MEAVVVGKVRSYLEKCDIIDAARRLIAVNKELYRVEEDARRLLRKIAADVGIHPEELMYLMDGSQDICGPGGTRCVLGLKMVLKFVGSKLGFLEVTMRTRACGYELFILHSLILDWC